jgi:tetratricopeptide (TPR) repeat protein
MKLTWALASIILLAASGAAQTGVVPDAAEVNSRMDRVRNLKMELAGQWPKQKSTIEGMPGLAPVSAWDAAAPPAATKELEKGNKAVEHGDAKAAIEHYEKALKHYPQYVSAYNNMGAAALLEGDNAKAQQALLEAVKLDPKQPVPMANLGRVSFSQRNFTAAEEYMNKAVALAPDPQNLTLLAYAEAVNGHYDAAIANGQKVHAGKHPQQGVIHLVMGTAYQSEHKTDEAIAEYQLFLKEDPKNPRAYIARQQLEKLGVK